MSTSISDLYTRYCRPTTGAILKALHMDMVYHRASGNFLYYYNEAGEEIQVTDFLGGYGAALFGHNHPRLVGALQQNLSEQRPFNTQASCRASFACMAEKLSSMLRKRSGCDYIVIGANSGTEVVEAAIKHAELAHQRRIQKIREQLQQTCVILSKQFKTGQVRLSEQFIIKTREHELFLGETHFAELLAAVKNHNLTVLEQPPILLSLKGAFHGKTCGSVQLTENQEYRLPFLRLGPSVSFIAPEELTATLEKAQLTYYWPVCNKKNHIELVERSLVNIVAFFIEPLQGEGGIRAIPIKALESFRQAATQHNIPLIFDEIQCGMGRTGSFIFSERAQVWADYYLFSKSLGGGLAKIGALAIDSRQFEEGFDLIHTSTFAEDDFSASVALEALNLLDSDSSIMESCKRSGEFLKAGLKTLQKQYPDVIADVRGHGLMLGIELQSQDNSPSNALVLFSRQKMLGYVASGYLLHEHNIRVAPTLSSVSTIRLEPSAFIEKAQCETLLKALKTLCVIIRNQNMYRLTRFIVGAECYDDDSTIQDFAPPPIKKTYAHITSKACKQVAFIGHFIDAKHLKLWDASYSPFSHEQCRQFITNVHQLVGPQIYKRIDVKSKTGELVCFSYIGICVDPATINSHMQSGTQTIIKDKIRAAVDLAIEQGCSMIGLGGYTSIITRNCTDLISDQIGITSGNSLAAGMGFEAIVHAAEQAKIDLQQASAAAVGASGNICSVYCEMLAEHVGTLYLIGKPGSEDRLRMVAAEIYQQAFQNVASHPNTPFKQSTKQADQDEKSTCLKGIAYAISKTQTVQQLTQETIRPSQLGRLLVTKLEQELGSNTPIRISTEISDIRHADLIVSASNSPVPIIFPKDLKKAPCIICDISVPMGTDESVMQQRPDVTVLQGGLVQLPFNKDFTISGMPLEPGLIFACMAETLLLGLTGCNQHYSYGRISKKQVDLVMGLAALHGFSMATPKTEKSY